MYRRLLILVVVFLLLSINSVWARPNPFALGSLTPAPAATSIVPRRSDYSHVSHTADFRNQVWNQHANRLGNVRDISGKLMKKGDPFHLGHQYGYERERMADHAVTNQWTQEQWLRSQKNSSIYRIEAPNTNMSNKYSMPREIKTSRQLAKSYDELAGISRPIANTARTGSNAVRIGRCFETDERILLPEHPVLKQHQIL